jgi:hypothetical protein
MSAKDIAFAWALALKAKAERWDAATGGGK